MKGNHQPFLSNSVLDRNYFNHLSAVEKVSRFKFHITRDISQLARKYVKDYEFKQPGRLDYITSN